MSKENYIFRDFEVSPDHIHEQCDDILLDEGKVMWIENSQDDQAIVTAQFPKGTVALFLEPDMYKDETGFRQVSQF